MENHLDIETCSQREAHQAPNALCCGFYNVIVLYHSQHYIYIYIYMFVHLLTYCFIHTCMYTYTYVCTRMCTYIYIYRQVYDRNFMFNLALKEVVAATN